MLAAAAIATAPSPIVASISQVASTPTGAPTLRLAVVSFYNPRLMYLKYQPLVDYLSQQTRWRFQLDLSPTYQQTIDRLCSGEVHVAYLGPFSYLRAQEACGARPIVRLNTRGRDSYVSYIMVRQDSGITSVAQLKGTTFAFGARLSTSSHLVPRAMLQQAGLRAGIDVRCRYFGHHDRAARAVLLGEAAACGVRDLVGDQFRPRGLRVLAQSAPVPNFPLVVAAGAPPDLSDALTAALIDRPLGDEAAAAVIAGWDAELAGGFAPAVADAYLPLRDLARRVFGPRALAMPPEQLTCGPETGSRPASSPR